MALDVAIALGFSFLTFCIVCALFAGLSRVLKAGIGLVFIGGAWLAIVCYLTDIAEPRAYVIDGGGLVALGMMGLGAILVVLGSLISVWRSRSALFPFLCPAPEGNEQETSSDPTDLSARDED